MWLNTVDVFIIGKVSNDPPYAQGISGIMLDPARIYSSACRKTAHEIFNNRYNSIDRFRYKWIIGGLLVPEICCPGV